MSEPLVRFDAVNIVFGDRPESALELMDRGDSREEIQEATGQILGVHDCSLSVGEGEIVVLMGLSGSGKSTLLRAVNGLNPVVRGGVWVHDGERPVDVGKLSPADLRSLRLQRIAMVFQQFGLLPWRTVLENISFGLELAGVEAGERRRRAEAQLTLVGLEGWGDRRLGELSGGMQQRVGLARAFATEAPILLMDEPFSALDPLIRNKLQDELLEFQSNLKRTIVFVSHDLDEALKIGNRIAIMRGGRIVQIGSPQDIVLRPADAYVADFVAHMNPLNVLRAVEVMRTCDPRPLPDGAMALEGGAGAAPRVTDPEVPVRALMQAFLASEAPILVAEGGQVVGEVEGADIVRALLRG
ncbi:MAG: choline ABC transporter ATP-binding protein [Rhodospirillales bacterium]